MKDYQIFTETDLSGEATSPFCLMSKALSLMTALYKNCENQPSTCYSNIIQRVFEDWLVQYHLERSNVSFQEALGVKGGTSCAPGKQTKRWIGEQKAKKKIWSTSHESSSLSRICKGSQPEESLPRSSECKAFVLSRHYPATLSQELKPSGTPETEENADWPTCRQPWPAENCHAENSCLVLPSVSKIKSRSTLPSQWQKGTLLSPTSQNLTAVNSGSCQLHLSQSSITQNGDQKMYS